MLFAWLNQFSNSFKIMLHFKDFQFIMQFNLKQKPEKIIK